MFYELEGSSSCSTKPDKNTYSLPLTPPDSSHSNANLPTYSYAESRPDSRPYTPLFSGPFSDILTPASTPPQSFPSPRPNRPLLEGHISSSTGRYPASGYPSYYATNNTSPLIKSINEHLLRVIALLESGFLENALAEADSALARSSGSNLPDMVSKCQLYRGASLIELKRWKEARRALVRAATVREWNDRVQALTREVDAAERRERRGERVKWEEGRERRLSWIVAIGW